MPTKDEYFQWRNDLDLSSWGFEKMSAFEYRSNDYFNVTLFEKTVMFCSKQFTTAVDYDKVEVFLMDKGLTKNTISQES